MNTLIDTGALTSDFISMKMARRLVSEYGATLTPTALTINTAFRAARPYHCHGRINFEIALLNELTDKMQVIELEALVIDTGYDLIIGRPSIIKYNLLNIMHNQILFGVQDRLVEAHNVTPTAMREGLRGVMNLLDTPCLCIGEYRQHSGLDRALSSDAAPYGCKLMALVHGATSEPPTERYPIKCLEDNVRPAIGTCPTTDYPSDSDEEEDDDWRATFGSTSINVWPICQ